MTTGARGSSVGVDQIPTVSVYLEPKEAGWVVRVGADALASGKWVSVEAAATQDVHNQAKIREALKSHTGNELAPKKPGSPKRAWPLPITSMTVLLADLDAGLAEHRAAATAWWHAHDVDLTKGEFPWLVAVSDVFVTPSTGRDVGTVGRLHGLGALAFMLGTLTGRYPASVVVACPDAGDRHRPEWLGTKNLKDYYAPNLCGVVPKAKAPLGRHSWTVGGDAAVAYVAAHGLTLPSRTLTAPMVVPAWVHPDAVTDLIYVRPDPGTQVRVAASRRTQPPVTVGRNEGIPASPVVEQVTAGSVPVITLSPEDRYKETLLAHVHAALAGRGDATFTDVLRAAAMAVVATPTPHGVTRRTAPGVALAAITQDHTAPHLNQGPEKVRESLQAAMN